ncbi:deoxyribodipyrimidine photo-lyase [Cellulomonas cellasea]|uniref:cryptochrome/photolyase family protein n=1 Tax=Cellulomonas cellasea TaxID=43670 RepID=UPI0025A4948A|nr:deoxyribodipyrimidine photo-lyase [Cellulomonas cellasea]MDM8085016.1 deoxyribodipyrimidine photo-lyase [Cellulomonas cellasea]
MTAIHWFRRDLRLADNPALLAAAAGGDVVGVFVLDDVLWRSAGAPRLAYLLRSLAALDASMDGRLVVLRGDPVDEVPRLARDVGAAAVHVAASHEPYGVRRDLAVEAALNAAGTALTRTGSAYAVDPGVLRTRTGSPFQVFTPFRTAWLEHGWPGPAGDAARVRWADPGGGAALPAEPGLGGLRLPDAGEDAARRRWASALDDVVPRYADERDRPDRDGTSRMSAALRWGEVHPRTLLADLGRLEGDGPAMFRSELAWREFHADVLHHHPSARTESLRPVAPEDAWAGGDREHALLTAWQDGRTGYPFVDAGMRQLRAEGWMHGRTRMVVASFLVKDLHIRWQRGAEHFLRWLVDADLSQNQLNWQWVAGTGRDAAPFFRVFNPVAQGQRFDPDGDYVRRWVPELRGVAGAAVHEPWRLPAGTVDYPERLVDHAVERRVALEDNARVRALR